MKYKSVLFILILTVIIAAPAAANLKKIDAKSPVFVGETGVDISTALNGCRQIGWWVPGNKTDSPPAKIIDIPEDKVHNYNFTPDVFSRYNGSWYCYYPKPVIEVFQVQKPEVDLKIWDLDHDVDVTGKSVPLGTNITYRIDTNMYPVLDKLERPDMTTGDSFMQVSLTSPAGNPIKSVFTTSAGSEEGLILAFDGVPRIKKSPYYWKDGARWNRYARSGEGGLLYPPGTYTFVLSQNLNGMVMYYNSTDPAVTTGPKTITFTAEEPVATTPSASKTATSQPVTTAQIPHGPTTSETAATSTVPVKTTWTSSPLPVDVTLAALCAAFACCLHLTRRSR